MEVASESEELVAIDLQRHGPYALITGASAGIGEEFAQQLASKGFNLILVARRKEKLDELASRIEKSHRVQTRVIDLDLKEPRAGERLFEKTKDLEVGLVVLNAGVYGFGRFLENGMQYDEDLLQLNVTLPLKMTHLFGRKMVDRKKGAILFVASTAGFNGLPFTATYSASKSYLLTLAEALNFEFKKHGVDVMALAPGMTKTEGQEAMRGVESSKMSVPLSTAEEVVAAALSGLGDEAIVIPGVLNRITVAAGKYLMSRKLQTKLYGAMIGKALK